MKRTTSAVTGIVMGFGFLLNDIRPAHAQAAAPPRAKTGRELFEHKWTAKDSLSPRGDGVGPVHNAVSCVACHHLGGLGGAGSNDHNVDLVTPIVKSVNGKEDAKTRKKLAELHPDFARGASTIMLHRLGTSAEYDPWRWRMLGIKVPDDIDAARKARMWAAIAKKQRAAPPVEELQVTGVKVLLSHRSTPALFGASLIDAIPAEVIRQQAGQQQGIPFGVTGRVPRANPELADPVADPADQNGATADGVGRFGWRGQTVSLREFVLGACANELGLEVPNHKQGLNPLDGKYVAPGQDLDREQCEKLVAFVRSLPRPVQVKPVNADAANLVDYGANLFRNVGCATCHVPNLGNVDGLFSDLLLHDMGPDLADPVPANPDKIVVGQNVSRFGYFGSAMFDVFAEVPSKVRQEWRTTPLWGVADSPPYLHDGRARTLEEAVVMHGGEATMSVAAFRSLPADDRKMVIAFLKTLRAPQNAVEVRKPVNR